MLCNNESVKINRAYAYTQLNDDEDSEQGYMECNSLFNGNNITTDFNNMWCTNFSPGSQCCHIVMEFEKPTEITSKYFYSLMLYLEYGRVSRENV